MPHTSLPMAILAFLDQCQSIQDHFRKQMQEKVSEEERRRNDLLESVLYLSGLREGIEILFDRLTEMLNCLWEGDQDMLIPLNEDESGSKRKWIYPCEKLRKKIKNDPLWDESRSREFAGQVLWELLRREFAFARIIHAWALWEAYFTPRKNEFSDFTGKFRDYIFGGKRIGPFLGFLVGRLTKLFSLAVKDFRGEETDSGSLNLSRNKEYNFDSLANMFADWIGIEKTYTEYNRGRSPRLEVLARYDLEHVRRRLEGLEDDAIVDVETFGIISFDPEGNLIQVPMNCYRAVNNQF